VHRSVVHNKYKLCKQQLDECTDINFSNQLIYILNYASVTRYDNAHNAVTSGVTNIKHQY